jgi:hypothetical protein
MIGVIKTVWQRIRKPNAATFDALGGMVITAAELDRWASGKILPEERERYDKYMALSDAQIKAQIAARFARRDFTIAERECFEKASQ